MIYFCVCYEIVFFSHIVIKLPQHFFMDSVFDFLELLLDNPYTELHFNCYNFIAVTFCILVSYRESLFKFSF